MGTTASTLRGKLHWGKNLCPSSIMTTPTTAMENTSGVHFGSPSPPPPPHMLGVRGWGKVFTAQRKKDVHKPGSKREARRLNYSGKLSPFSVFGYVAPSSLEKKQPRG